MLGKLKFRESEFIPLGLLICFLGCQGACAQGMPTPVADPTPAWFDMKGGYSILTGTMGDMTWPEIETAAKNHAIVLLPVGVIEEHGPHIACGTDIYLAYLDCRLVSQELAKRDLPAIIGPPIYWGINSSTRNFPGSFDVRPEIMTALLTDILANLKHWGFSEIYYVNLHGEAVQNLVIVQSAKESRQQLQIDTRVVMSDRMSRRFGLKGDEHYILSVDYDPPPGGPNVAVPDFHAGAEETGDMVAFFPDLVNRKLVGSLKAPSVEEGGYSNWGKDARKVTPLGYAGDPAAYDSSWSRKAVLDYCMAIAQAIEKKHKSKN
jgi:creatinine amidohydrolase